MVISKASIKAAKEILNLQKLAYQSEAKIYDDFSIPPLTQTLNQIKADFETKYFLQAKIDEQIIGSVRGYQDEDTCFVARLIVNPKFQGQGIGTKLMERIEVEFTEAERFELFTGHKSEKNIQLYQKLGYYKFKEGQITSDLTFVFMEKSNLRAV
jgi:ribosomal protein S18 acetylase RimI-like enzyme